MMNQKTATYEAIRAIVNFEDNDRVSLTKEQKAKVRDILVKGFEKGEIELKSPQDDLTKYVNSLINNWLRKDKRLNGGIDYEIKNKGSRAGQQDPMIKNLRLLKKTEGLSATDVADIDAAIKSRLAEIKPTKTVEIDLNQIPEELRAKLGL